MNRLITWHVGTRTFLSTDTDVFCPPAIVGSILGGQRYSLEAPSDCLVSFQRTEMGSGLVKFLILIDSSCLR
jgi:hypothetical protein